MAEALRGTKREKCISKEYIRLILKEENLVLFYKKDRWSEHYLFRHYNPNEINYLKEICIFLSQDMESTEMSTDK